MVPTMASFGYASTLYDDRGMPDPAALPEAYEGVLWRRTLAYFVDMLAGTVVVRRFPVRWATAQHPLAA